VQTRNQPLSAGKWHTLGLRIKLGAPRNSIDSLDVSLLHEHILSPVFASTTRAPEQANQLCRRRSRTAELEKLVNSGEYALRVLDVSHGQSRT